MTPWAISPFASSSDSFDGLDFVSFIYLIISLEEHIIQNPRG